MLLLLLCECCVDFIVLAIVNYKNEVKGLESLLVYIYHKIYNTFVSTELDQVGQVKFWATANVF